MQKCLALLLLALTAVSCLAQNAASLALPSFNDKDLQAWWTKYPTPDLWPKAADDLQAQLETELQAERPPRFHRFRFSGLDGAPRVGSGSGLSVPTIFRATISRRFLALGEDPTVSHLLVQKLDPLDVKEPALAYPDPARRGECGRSARICRAGRGLRARF